MYDIPILPVLLSVFLANFVHGQFVTSATSQANGIPKINPSSTIGYTTGDPYAYIDGISALSSAVQTAAAKYNADLLSYVDSVPSGFEDALYSAVETASTVTAADALATLYASLALGKPINSAALAAVPSSLRAAASSFFMAGASVAASDLVSQPALSSFVHSEYVAPNVTGPVTSTRTVTPTLTFTVSDQTGFLAPTFSAASSASSTPSPTSSGKPNGASTNRGMSAAAGGAVLAFFLSLVAYL